MAPPAHSPSAGLVAVAIDEIDGATADEFRALIHAALAADRAGDGSSPPRRLLLDLRGTTFMDSTGIRALIEADTRARDGGVEIRVVAEGMIRHVLEVTGLWDHFGAEVPT